MVSEPCGSHFDEVNFQTESINTSEQSPSNFLLPYMMKNNFANQFKWLETHSIIKWRLYLSGDGSTDETLESINIINHHQNL